PSNRRDLRDVAEHRLQKTSVTAGHSSIPLARMLIRDTGMRPLCSDISDQAEKRSPTSHRLLLCFNPTHTLLIVVVLSLAPRLARVNTVTGDHNIQDANASPATFNAPMLNARSLSPFLRPNDETAFSMPIQSRSRNPVVPGWYADPEARVFQGEYWIYPTYSAPYDQQLFMDAFSSKDLITWQKHSRILDTADVRWARRALWAPSVVEKDGWFYLFFGANDIQNDSQPGGIGVARARRPGGPFKDYLGKPLVDKFHNGAQPIDPFVFKDTDGSHYLIYGGWKHCNIAKLNHELNGFVPFADGGTFKEITPKGYVEGSFMFVKDGKYYFMWSEGG